MQTKRLYYDDSNLLQFRGRVRAVRAQDERTQVALDETAFYPTSGGQPFDTGILASDGQEWRVVDVGDDDEGTVWHTVQGQSAPSEGVELNGSVDAARRLDHRQQHTGQHLLSAILWERFGFATVSFHLGTETCTIDLNTPQVTAEQLEQAREEANQIIAENRPLSIHYASVEEARNRGVRKIAAGHETVRLIEIPGIDLNACGGTHVNATGEIGCLLTRKLEKVKQGTGVEFVCGLRAVRTAMHDYQELRSAGEVVSAGVWSVAEQMQKLVLEQKQQSKRLVALQNEVVQLKAGEMAKQGGLLRQSFTDRDAGFVKLLAQNVVRLATEPTLVLFAAAEPTPTLVLARSEHESLKSVYLGEVLKTVLARYSGRGGGSASLAQGGIADREQLEAALEYAAELVRSAR